MPQKAYENRGCEGWKKGGLSEPCYPDMLSKAEWEQFKLTDEYKEVWK